MNKQELKKTLIHEMMRYRRIIKGSKKDLHRDLYRENYCIGRLDGIHWTLFLLEQLEQ